MTKFDDIYQMFMTKTTDDMYLETTKEETQSMQEELLVTAIPWFEFPRFAINNFKRKELIEVGTYRGVESGGVEVPAYIYSDAEFEDKMSREEKDILATYMVVEWLGQQLASVENTRMKYSGSDFNLTSQANHMSKLNSLKKSYIDEGFHLQRLYSRRKEDDQKIYRPTMASIMENSVRG